MMSRNITLLKNHFSTPNGLVEYIKMVSDLKGFFMRGACSQLAKIIYDHFISKRENSFKLLCFVEKEEYNFNARLLKKMSDSDFLDAVRWIGVAHVGLIAGNQIYDAHGVSYYFEDEYEHPVLSRDTFYYKEIDLPTVAKAKEIFADIMRDHRYGHKKQAEIAEMIMHSVKFR